VGDQRARACARVGIAGRVEETARIAPLQIAIGDASVDGLLSSTNYTVDGVDVGTGDAEVNLAAGEATNLVSAKDPSTGLDVVKTLALDGDSYIAELELTIKRASGSAAGKAPDWPKHWRPGRQHIRSTRFAPEAVAAIGDEVHRNPAQGINENKKTPDKLVIPGPVNWGGVGDTYFSMVAAPANHR